MVYGRPSCVNICSSQLVYQSTDYFSNGIDLNQWHQSTNRLQIVYKWYTNGLRSFPFVPMVRIVRLLWRMVIFYQWYHWWGFIDDWYLFVYIGHVWFWQHKKAWNFNGLYSRLRLVKLTYHNAGARWFHTFIYGIPYWWALKSYWNIP